MGLYSSRELSLLYETDIEMYSSMPFSDNSQYLLICSLGSYFIIVSPQRSINHSGAVVWEGEIISKTEDATGVIPQFQIFLNFGE